MVLQYFPGMFDATFQHSLESAISSQTSQPFTVARFHSIGGGCINSAAAITGDDGRAFFLKHNTRSFLPVFEEEANALHIIAQTDSIRVPRPIVTFQAGHRAALVLELLQFSGSRTDFPRMGRELARLHKSTAKAFGWHADNWIGSSPQSNQQRHSWIDFYGECRLGPQFHMAQKNGLRLDNDGALLRALPAFFESYTPLPSLLHGDLWSGNAGFLSDSTPVLYDPAAYYGDREADLAMTRLFGGFPQEFYSAYDNEWPVDTGFRIRKDLYNLYHVLNHFNLFGGGYGSQAASMINSLLHSLDN